MADYHLHVKNISRTRQDGRRRSAVAVAAYRAGAVLRNDYEGGISDFAAKADVIHAEILAPNHAPDWALDREVLWNAVDAVERRKDSRLAKEVEFALPREIPIKEGIAVARLLARDFAAWGCVVDVAVHNDGANHNPHVHLLMTTREIGPEGFGPKLKKLYDKAFVLFARKRWEELGNAALVKVGSMERIDHRSYRERGIEREPTRHRGADQRERNAKRQRGRQTMDRYPIVTIDEVDYYRDMQRQEFRNVDDPNDRIFFDDPRVRDFVPPRLRAERAETPVRQERAAEPEDAMNQLKRREAEREVVRDAEDGPIEVREEKRILERLKRAGEIARHFLPGDKRLMRDLEWAEEDRRRQAILDEQERYDPGPRSGKVWDRPAEPELPRESERDRPGPGPEGRPIQRESLERAQQRMLDEYELSKKERAQHDAQDRMVRDYERSDRDNDPVRQELERATQERRDEKRREREEREREERDDR